MDAWLDRETISIVIDNESWVNRVNRYSIVQNVETRELFRIVWWNIKPLIGFRCISFSFLMLCKLFCYFDIYYFFAHIVIYLINTLLLIVPLERERERKRRRESEREREREIIRFLMFCFREIRDTNGNSKKKRSTTLFSFDSSIVRRMLSWLCVYIDTSVSYIAQGPTLIIQLSFLR